MFTSSIKMLRTNFFANVLFSLLSGETRFHHWIIVVIHVSIPGAKENTNKKKYKVTYKDNPE